MIVTSNSDGTIEDIDTASCLDRLHNYIISKLVGKKPVMINIGMSVVKPTDCYYVIDATRLLVCNCAFPILSDGTTIKISQNNKGNN